MFKRPALFISHGSPMIAVEDDDYTAALEKLGEKLSQPHPLAVVVVSAHWEEHAPVRVTANPHPDLIYDFGGFPNELYEKAYPCPGDPKLARHIVDLLHGSKIKADVDEKRGLDHGAWTPLSRIFSSHEIPVVEVSLPSPRQPTWVFEMGRALAKLRNENILLMGTGGIVHNLRKIRMGAKDAIVDDWAQEFDEWVRARLEHGDVAALLNYKKEGPHADVAVQGPEHFDPLFFALGAAEKEPIRFVYEGFHYGNLSMRSFEIGA
jgi:4,5-DOPA dioxygenase extradiol